METIDDEWESFLQNDGDELTPEPKPIDDNNISEKNISNDVNSIPKCSPIYISTKTIISYLNKNEIDIKKVFWDIPILDYSSPEDGIIKKQIKYSSVCQEEVDAISHNLEDVKYFEEQIIEHIENPDGRIKYKDNL